MNDISQSVAIREEAKKQFLDSIARSYSDPTVIHTTKVDYKKTAAYTSNFNRHYIAIDFDTNIVREGDVFATVYMEVDEIDGQFTIIQPTSYAAAKVSDKIAVQKYQKSRENMIKRVNEYGKRN